jgi:hypothetical protein
MAVPAAALAVGAFATLWSSARSVSDGATSPSLTPTDVYARMAQGMTAEGMVFHTVVSTESRQGDQTISQLHEIWIDVGRGVARAELSTAFEASGENTRLATWIIDGNSWYQAPAGEPARQRLALVCRDAPGPLIALLTGCGSFLEESTTVADEAAPYEGRPALRLLTTGTVQGAAEWTQFTEALYVDAGTMLPLAVQSAGLMTVGGREQRTARTSTFDNSFVPAGSLAPDFFSPASIGFVEGDAAEALKAVPPDLAYRWPGRRIEGTDELPALVLANIYVADDAVEAAGYEVELRYRPADDQFAPAAVVVRVWREDTAWHAAADGRLVPELDARCPRDHRALPAQPAAWSSAVITGWTRDGARCSVQLHSARLSVDFAAMVVVPGADSPWNSESGVIRVLESLQPAGVDVDATRAP